MPVTKIDYHCGSESGHHVMQSSCREINYGFFSLWYILRYPFLTGLKLHKVKKMSYCGVTIEFCIEWLPVEGLKFQCIP